jgi:hypothetical protein
LDPSYANSDAKSRRSKLYEQRLLEANGGELATFVGSTFSLTAMLVAYSSMKA